MISILGIILVLFAIVLIPVAISTFNHNNRSKTEAEEYLPSESMIEVGAKRVHVYSDGQGTPTLVFMSGHGTNHPALDFKPLWKRLVDDYRIAVVERPGYGWSEVSGSPRDIDTLLEETRRALQLSGRKPPYALIAHSMAGLEAIHWARQYPDEVTAIIGLDPCTPETLEILPKPNKLQLYAMHIISRVGLSRYMPDPDVQRHLPLMSSEYLTEEDKAKYLAAFYRNSFSKDMMGEVRHLKDNAEMVAENGLPIDTPMLFFISDDQASNITGWKEALCTCLSKVSIGQYVELSTGHYVHYHKSNVIADEVKAFLDCVK